MAGIALAFAGGSMMGPMLLNLGISAALIGLSFLLPRPKIEGPRLDSLKVSGDAVGQPIAKVWGYAPVTGHVVWLKGNQLEEVKKTETPGKGGPTTVTYTYYGTFAAVCCDTEIVEYKQIWFDDLLVWGTDTEAKIAEGVSLTLYYGTQTQEPNSVMVAALGADRVSGFRGTAYIVVNRLNLEKWGNRIPNIRFVVTTQGELEYRDTIELDPRPDIPGDRGQFYSGRNVTYVPYIGQLVGFTSIAATTLYCAIYDRFTGTTLEVRTITRPHIHFSDDIVVDDNGFMYAVSQSGGGGIGICNWNTLSHVGYLDSANFEVDGALLRYVHNSSQTYGWLIAFETGFIAVKKLTIGDLTAPSSWDTELLGTGLGGQGAVIDTDGKLWWIDDNELRWLSVSSPLGSILAFDETSVPAFDLDVMTGLTVSDVKFLDYSSTLDCLCVLFTVDDGGGDTGIWAMKVDLDGALIVQEKILSTGAGMEDLDWQVRLDMNQIGFKLEDNNDVYVWDFNSMEVSYFWDESEHTINPSIDCNGALWLASQRAIIFREPFTRAKLALMDVTDPSKVPVADIIEDICVASDIPAARIDTSLVDELALVDGFIIDQLAGAKDSLDDLMNIWLIDAVDDGEYLKFISRGQNDILNVSIDQFGAGERQMVKNLSSETIASTFTIPRIATLEHFDPANRLEKSIQGPVSRQATVVSSNDAVKINTKCVLDVDTAAQQLQKMFRASWRHRDKHSFQLPYTNMRLHAGDVITFSKNSETLSVLIEEIQYDFAIMKIDGVLEDLTGYTSVAEGSSGTNSGIAIDTYAATFMQAFDMHTLLEEDVDANFYVIGYPVVYGLTWNGYDIYKATTVAGTYSVWASSDRQGVYGNLTSACDEYTEWHLIDYGTELDVYVPDPDFAPESMASLSEFFTDITQNVMCIRQAATGEVEILRYMTATNIGTRKWRFSDLKRGQRGTEQFTEHAAGDFVFFPSYDSVARVGPAAEDEVGLTRYYRTATYGTYLDTTKVPLTFQNTARGLRPFAPENVSGAWDSTDILITWDRRQKKYSMIPWFSSSEMPLDDVLEQYELLIIDSDDDTVLRTEVITDAQEYLYEAADILADFGVASPTNIRFEVRTYGTGYGYGLIGSGVMEE
jgi:hypothetical protein